MLVIGDVKCLHCGFISGRWVGPKGSPLTGSGLKTPTGDRAVGRDEVIRCGRCEGPVFLDDANMVTNSYRLRRIQRMREQLAALDGRDDRAA